MRLLAVLALNWIHGAAVNFTWNADEQERAACHKLGMICYGIPETNKKFLDEVKNVPSYGEAGSRCVARGLFLCAGQRPFFEFFGPVMYRGSALREKKER